ncbi:hypothetical protein [Streptococcus salivarius]|uniref:hypothetical protein n=1 Tax=Streptococcus salivarius TaxID=1304 RepID=UPI0007E467D4|nr:hypothetical protein [Streptococcus salivarius]
MIQSFVTTQEQEMMLQDYLKGQLRNALKMARITVKTPFLGGIQQVLLIDDGYFASHYTFNLRYSELLERLEVSCDKTYKTPREFYEGEENDGLRPLFSSIILVDEKESYSNLTTWSVLEELRGCDIKLVPLAKVKLIYTKNRWSGQRASHELYCTTLAVPSVIAECSKKTDWAYYGDDYRVIAVSREQEQKKEVVREEERFLWFKKQKEISITYKDYKPLDSAQEIVFKELAEYFEQRLLREVLKVIDKELEKLVQPMSKEKVKAILRVSQA